jgi:uncharacterized protein DUF1264
MFRTATLLALALVILSGCNTRNSPPPQSSEGQQKSGSSKALEAGAKTLQATTPVNQFDIYLVGFHPMKDSPQTQMEAHHYCHQVNEDFAQCALFDGNTKDAQLNGIEYIISEKMFNSLPRNEKQYWHPHNYEIFSGQLVAPGLPEAAEHALMSKKVNSYGKTWHVWKTDDKGKPADKLPLGMPHLAWSFSHDGEITPGMIETRDQRMGINSAKKREQRADLVPQGHPQQGVNTLKQAFPNADDAPRRVIDSGAKQ